MKRIFLIILILISLSNINSQNKHPLFDQLYGRYEWIGDWDYENKRLLETKEDYPNFITTFFFSPFLVYIDDEYYTINGYLFDKYLEQYQIEEMKIMIEDNTITIKSQDEDRYKVFWMIGTSHEDFPNNIIVTKVAGMEINHFILQKITD